MTRKLIIGCLQSIIDIYEMIKNEKPWANVPIDSEDVEAIRLSIEKWGEQNAEPCEDAISRAAAIKAMDDLEQEDIERYGCSIPEGFDGKRAIEALQSLPLVTPKQKMGHWEYTGTYDEDGMLECSVCGREVDPSYYHYKFCPMCGAKMAESEGGE